MRLETPIVLEEGSWQEVAPRRARVAPTLWQRAWKEALGFLRLKQDARLRQKVVHRIVAGPPEAAPEALPAIPGLPDSEALEGRIEARWLWEVTPKAHRAREVVTLVDLDQRAVSLRPEEVSALLAYGDALLSLEIRRARSVYPQAVPFLVQLKARTRTEGRVLLRLGAWKPDPVPGWALALRREPAFVRWARKHGVFPVHWPLWVFPETRETPGWLSLPKQEEEKP